MGHVTPRQTSEREFDAPPGVAAANYARSDAHARIKFFYRFSRLEIFIIEKDETFYRNVIDKMMRYYMHVSRKLV